MIESKDIVEAIERIAHTEDGQLLYRYLQKTLCAVMIGDLSDGALRQFEGRRSFAAEIMGLMSKGISDSDRYAITFSSPSGRRADPGPRGARRRVTLDTAVAGWDTDASTGRPGTPSSGTA